MTSPSETQTLTARMLALTGAVIFAIGLVADYAIHSGVIVL